MRGNTIINDINGGVCGCWDVEVHNKEPLVIVGSSLSSLIDAKSLFSTRSQHHKPKLWSLSLHDCYNMLYSN